jgi:cell division protein FtsQ
VTGVRLRRPSSLPKRLALGRAVRGTLLLGAAALAAIAVVRLAGWVERSESLPVRTIAVHGVEGARQNEVLAYAGVVLGRPLFSVDVDAVAARVLEHPFVASARVRRVIPDGIEITVTPREARAVLAEESGLYLVDATGHVMKTARAGDGLDLPVITGVSSQRGELESAMALATAYEEAGAPGGPLSEIHFVPGAGFELVLDAGVRVRIGNNNLPDKLGRLTEVFRRLAEARISASHINIDDERRPERAAVRLRPRAEMRPVGGKNIPRERG